MRNGSAVVSRSGSISPESFGRRGSVGQYEDEMNVVVRRGQDLSINSHPSSNTIRNDMSQQDVLELLIAVGVSANTLDRIAEFEISGADLLAYNEQEISLLCDRHLNDQVKLRVACGGGNRSLFVQANRDAPFVPLAPQVVGKETLDEQHMLECMVRGRTRERKKKEGKRERSAHRSAAQYVIPENANVRKK